ncbi:MAG: 50S ribosomal protein L29 [Candidatus Moranbacteria bacterium]|jgi:ribosomal protein L29|nr:50S ribosomal protein L29 [Candidatus Moranbacteria bacterium]
MKINEIKEKNSKELEKLLAEKRNEVRELRFNIFSKQAKDHRKYFNCKKEVAQILTVLNSGESK